MSFNKKILALAIVSALPGAAFAFVNMDAPTTLPSVIPTYPLEVPIPTGLNNNGSNAPIVLPNTTAAGDLSVTVQLGAAIVGSNAYLRFDFPDTVLAANLLNTNFGTFDNAPTEFPAAGGTFTIAGGGTAGSNYVVVAISGANLSNLDSFNFVLSSLPVTLSTGAGGSITALNHKGAHSIRYRFYDTSNLAAALSGAPNTGLPDKTSTWYTFATGIDLSCNRNGVNTKQIDVTNPVNFVGGSPNDQTDLFNLVANTTGVINQNGTALVIGDYLSAGATFAVSGNVRNMLGATGTLELNGLDVGTYPTSTSASWIPPTPVALPYVSALVSLDSDGSLPLLPGDYDVSVTQGPTPNYILPASALFLDNCGRLDYSGSSDRVDYGLTPGSANKQYLRITNPTSTGGAVNVSVWNDAGVQVDFPLSAVKVGPAPGVNLPLTLGAYSSTPIIDVNAFDAAAKSVNAGFSVGTGIDGKPGKIRIEVRGNFGDNHVDGVRPGSFLGKPSATRLKNGIYIQAINNGNFHQSH